MSRKSTVNPSNHDMEGQTIGELITRVKKMDEELATQHAEVDRLRSTLDRRDQRISHLTTRTKSLSATIVEQYRQGARRDAEILRAFGARGSRPFVNPPYVVGLDRYSRATLALRTPLWLMTFDLPKRRKLWLEAKLILESGLFDGHYYLSTYPDVAEAGIDPCSHFVRGGAGEGRNPNPLFDTSYYLSNNPDVAESGLNPLVHFILSGAPKDRSPGPNFDTSYYLRNNPEVARSGVNPLLHYIETGIWKGRAPKPPPLVVVQESAADATMAPGAQSGARAEITAEPTNPGDHTTPGEESSQTALLPVPNSPKNHPRVRTIAFYLPQFHPIPENDEWWGPGFTEWTNVSTARPLFPGHKQPQTPSELGFYDLRLPETRTQQAELAREHGINGFCYYYYWFNGREILERPLREMLASGRPDFPFCLCWANENWTRRWDGFDNEILLAQEQDPESDTEFIGTVLSAMLDPRYICIDGKPMLLVYRADLMADPRDTTRKWREAAVRVGFPGLHLCAVEFGGVFDPRPFGFDALVEFPPHSLYQQGFAKEMDISDEMFAGKIFDYARSVAAVTDRPSPEYPLYRGVMPRWDNTPRRGKNAWVYHGSTPEIYRGWLKRMLYEVDGRPGNADQFVFINAWNEWAEGASLE
ncbi:MAG: glycoside hydrolase family 99-like domain-containing protein, partial [Thermoanaerobaculales bacterium]|nr:glycoside hydrolase family 99-like domain-containing protein [Thermoanaerobaculales bacterium]